MKSASPDAIELLDADHRVVKALFDDYRQLSGHQGGAGKRKALAEQICLQLAIHMRLEEEIFDPAVRDAVLDDDLLDDAEVEHARARELIAQILSMQPEHEIYDAKVTVLGEYIEHHAKQESQAMFPEIRKCGIDLGLLGDQLRVRRKELDAVLPALREDALTCVSA
ncbi:MAG: hemerythrin domain-containing protein [Ramlibacter sp.]